MTAIGIDSHKATLAACAIDELGKPVAEATFANDPDGHVAFIAWARSTAPGATVGIEGSSSFGVGGPSPSPPVGRRGLVLDPPPGQGRLDPARHTSEGLRWSPRAAAA